MPGPLTGLTVLDFSSGMAGGLAGAVFADFGAEVIKVEPPSGDPGRKEAAWIGWNRGKQSAVIDLETPEGREQARQLALRADVLLESSPPGTMARYDLGYDTLAKANPLLVYTSISGWGQHGPLAQVPASEGAIAAKSGRMKQFEGQPDREGPVYVAVRTATWAASQAAVRGTLAVLRVRNERGRGQWVQTSLLQGMIPYEGRLINRPFTRRDPQSFPAARGAGMPTLQYTPVRTKDGRWMQHANLMVRLYHSYLRAVGLGWVFEDDRFKTAPALNDEAREQLRDIMFETAQEKTLDEWMRIYVDDGNVAAEPYLYTVEGMQHEQFLHNEHVVEVDDPRVGKAKILGLLANLGETSGKVGGPAPEVGQHTAQVLAKIATPAPAVASAAVSNGAPKAVLDGVTILDFSTVIAGPYGAAMLGDMGARIIKVDATPEREQTRMSAAGANALNGLKLYAGKECIQVDLQTEDGQRIVHQLIENADVLLHNFRPGVPARLGIDWETCQTINPRLIHMYIGAYGPTGPHHRRPGAHPLPGALFGGALRQAGASMPPDPSQPMDLAQIRETARMLMRANEGNPDPNSSQAVSTSIMLGLYAREVTGRGQSIWATMMQANAWANADEAYDFEGRPGYAIPDAGCYGLHALYRLYRASEGWVFLAALTDAEWQAFCRTAEHADLLGDPRFASDAARREHDAELIEALETLFATKPSAEWESLLTAVGVACVEAHRDSGEFFEEHPQAVANHLAEETNSASGRVGRYLRHGGIVQFSDSPGRFGPGAFGGEHTVRLMEELGYTASQIAAFREHRVIDWEEPNRNVAALS